MFYKNPKLKDRKRMPFQRSFMLAAIFLLIYVLYSAGGAIFPSKERLFDASGIKIVPADSVKSAEGSDGKTDAVSDSLENR